MLTKRQYQILNSCADDWELFYFPFAEVNHGGQVVRQGDFSDRMAKHLKLQIPAESYEHKGKWSVSVSGLEIAYDIRILVGLGFLRVQRVDKAGKRTLVGPAGLTKNEFSVYRDYDCLTFDDDLQKFDYGPHEFTVTDLGVGEINHPQYREYDRELGWI